MARESAELVQVAKRAAKGHQSNWTRGNRHYIQILNNFHKLMHLCHFLTFVPLSFLEERFYVPCHLHFNNRHARLFICGSSALRSIVCAWKNKRPRASHAKRETLMEHTWHQPRFKSARQRTKISQTLEVIVCSTFWSLASQQQMSGNAIELIGSLGASNTLCRWATRPN